MASYKEKKLTAKSLYLKSDMSRKDIAKIAGITEKTLRKWINDENWDQLKAIESITRKQLLQDAYRQLKRINEYIDKELDGIPNKEMSDAKAVIRKEIESLSESPLHIYIEVSEELIYWLQSKHPGEVKKITGLLSEFIEMKAGEKGVR